MHRLTPSEPYVEAPLRKEPQGILCTAVSSIVGIKQERHLAGRELVRPSLDFDDLFVGDLVRHDRDRWHAEGVEAEHVVEALDDDDAAAGDRFAVARFIKAARVLSEEFEAPVKTYREAMLGRFLFLRPLVGRQCVERLFLRLELRIAAPGPTQAVSRLHSGPGRVEKLAAAG